MIFVRFFANIETVRKYCAANQSCILQGVNYRILYFFYENKAAVLAHGIVKEKIVPPADIGRAVERKKKFEEAPETHTYQRSRDD